MAAEGSSPTTSNLSAYFEETRRPIYSLILVLPFVFIYQLGVWAFHSNVINGGDALIRRLLSLLSVNTAFAGVLVLLICFIIWQVKTKASWKVDTDKVGFLFLESLIFAELLFHLMGWIASAPAASVPAESGRGLLGLVLYCGAGVYEELVFRVLLLGLLMLVLTKLLNMAEFQAAIWAVIVGAALFSLFHYIGTHGDEWNLNGFIQRMFAGLYFSVLFVTRNFGVACAAHALYDVRVGLYDLI
jgi:hypothetical protein